MKTIQFACSTLLAAAALCVGASGTHAAGVVPGQYAGSVILGPVLLDGRYPFTVGEGWPGVLDASTSVSGLLSASVAFGGHTEDAVGKITVRDKTIRLTLRGKLDEGRVAVDATLRGSAFVGTVKMAGQTAPCRIEMSRVGPLKANYELTLACAANGRVTGTGTLTVAREQIPVKVRGSARKGRLSVVVAGGGTMLRLVRGEIAEDSVTVTGWKAKGFGAAVKAGRPLRLLPQ